MTTTTATQILAGAGALPAPADALATYSDFRGSLGHGKATRGEALLRPASDNMKTAKSERPAFTLSLAPHRDAVAILGDEISLPSVTVCPWSTPACRDICVSYGGNGRYPRTQRLRAVKTAFAMLHPDAFLSLLLDDIERGAARVPHGAMRLNTFSDIAWERVLPRDAFGMLAAYDYTKGGIRRYRAAAEVGYRLTLSVSERTNLASVDSWLAEGANVAVVFPSANLPATWRGHRVIDGDKSDDRTADPHGVVVGLKAKGRLREARHESARVFIRGAA